MRGEPIYMTFLNYLGGFEYFFFTAEKEFQLDISESQTTRKNIFPNWPNSYGETADTIDRKAFTTSKNKIIVKSQHLNENQRDALKYIKTSPVVQIVYSRRNRRTVIVDSGSYKIYDEGERLYTIQFSISYTDEIPSQRI
jgi:hypothetical protein